MNTITNTTIATAATHSGVFHADDVLSAAILRGICPQVRIIRTRNPRDWDGADVIFDVGAKADGQRWFDHHQRERAGARENGVMFSSAGLVWRRFGVSYLAGLGQLGVDLAELASRVDTALIEGIDAVDNGQLSSTHKVGESELRVQDLSNVLSVLNPVALFEGDREEDFSAAFEEAVGVAGLILRKIALREAATLLARNEILAADKGGSLLIMERFFPWQETVIPLLPNVLLVTYPSPDRQWRLQVVPPALGDFGARLPLPEAWKGLRDEDFVTETGVADATFCHPGGFIAGTKTREGIIRLAELALGSA